MLPGAADGGLEARKQKEAPAMRGPTPRYREPSDSHRRCAFDRPLLKHRRDASEHRVELTAMSDTVVMIATEIPASPVPL